MQLGSKKLVLSNQFKVYLWRKIFFNLDEHCPRNGRVLYTVLLLSALNEIQCICGWEMTFCLSNEFHCLQKQLQTITARKSGSLRDGWERKNEKGGNGRGWGELCRPAAPSSLSRSSACLPGLLRMPSESQHISVSSQWLMASEVSLTRNSGPSSDIASKGYKSKEGFVMRKPIITRCLRHHLAGDQKAWQKWVYNVSASVNKCYGTGRPYLNIYCASESWPPVPSTEQLTAPNL